jgi:serine/threonine protein kinase/tetratricopeptide (TPR) repeat protein
VLSPIPEAPTRFAGPVPDAQGAATEAPQDEFTRIAPLPAGAGSAEEPPTTFSEPAADATKMLGAPPTSGANQSRQKGESGPLKVGEAFGPRYHIIRMLGIGGMGAVYQAWDAELGVSVAIKVIRPEAMADPEAAAEIERRFKRELLLARLVTHKNVVRIHDIGEVAGIKYITMPFVDGDDVATIVKKSGRLPIGTTLRIARSVVSGLVAAHAAGVVHRDLKPANIMVDSDGEAMIMDFGIARSTGGAPKDATLWKGMPSQVKKSMPAFADATTFGAVVGTVEYMAPEQAKGQAVDQRADIYAFGLILYDLLVARRRAAHAVSAIAELQGRMEKAPPPPRSIEPDIPDAVERIVLRCIEPDAAKRYQTTVELEADLNRLDDAGHLIPIPARFSKKMIAAGATLVLVLVSGTWYFTRTPPAVKPHDPVSVLIADFENKTDDPTFDHTLEPILRMSLEGASFISANDRTRIRASFGVPAPEKLDEAAARQIAIKQAVGIVMSGSIARNGSGYEVAVKATQPVTGNIVAEVKRSASDKDQVLGTVTTLAASVRKVLGDKTSESAQLFAMKSITTTSLEALGQYATGVELQSKGKFEDARQAFLKAVELDPKFGLGYQSLAAMSRNVGKLEDAEKYAKEALRSLDTMTERERFNVRGYYYRSVGDLPQCVSEYGKMLARYSGDTVARNQRAVCMVGLRDMRGAVDELRQAVQILPNHVGYRANLAIFMNYAGDAAGAEKEVQAMKDPPVNAKIALAFSQTLQGKLGEAADTYTSLGSTARATFAAAALGDLALYEGRFADAVRIFEQGAAADLAAKNSDTAANKFASLAYVQLMRGRKDAAIAAAEKVLADSKVIPYRLLAARVLIEAGTIAPAEALAADLASRLAAEPQAYGKILQGEIALKKRDFPQAVKILGDANSVVDTWLGHFDLGRAYLEAGEFTRADSEFDICIKRRGETLSLLNEDPTYGMFPPVYYYQGRAREGLQTEGFAASYREYLKIRGNSTEDPLLPEVRKRAGSQSIP